MLVGPDAEAPVLRAPQGVVEEATGPEGAVVAFEVTATNVVDSSPEVACEPASESTFPLGTTTVTCTVTDDGGNTAEVSFDVTVEDTTPPELSVPSEVSAEATGPDGAVVTFEVTATDVVDSSVPPTCDPPSGSTFPVGTTTVTCTASDASGNAATASVEVTVEEAPPRLLVLVIGVGVAGAAVAGVVLYLWKRKEA